MLVVLSHCAVHPRRRQLRQGKRVVALLVLKLFLAVGGRQRVAGDVRLAAACRKAAQSAGGAAGSGLDTC
jgi:hypothetical protein